MNRRRINLQDVLLSIRHVLPNAIGKGLSFSQYGEDLLISRIGSIPRDSFYIDVGAAYPVKHSNTYRFYLRGGSGITVEPNPDFAKLHKRTRPRDQFVQAGISPKAGTLNYFRFEVPDYNTFDKDTADRVAGIGVSLIDTLEVQTMPLKQLLEENCANREIDFMSIDCEGLDFDVIRSSDWSAYRPKIIVIEDHEWDFQSQPQSKISDFMQQVDYKMSARMSYSSVFVRSS